MGISFKNSSSKPVRYVSLPCDRSHPNVDRMEKMLNEVKAWESTLSSCSPSAEMICSGLSHLTTLYEYLEDLLNTNLHQTSTVFSNHTMKWTDELLDVSVKFLDICRNTCDVMSQIKQQVRDFGCDLRRTTNGGCSTESIIAKYFEFRNKVKKDIKGSMASLKKVDYMIHVCPLMIDSENYHLMCVFREVTTFSTVIFRSLLEFLAIPCLRRRQTGKWKLALSKFLSRSSKVVPEDEADMKMNELRRLDAAISRYNSSEKQEFSQVVQMNLEAVEATLEDINSHLHLMSRRLILTRVSILNMVSSTNGDLIIHRQRYITYPNYR